MFFFGPVVASADVCRRFPMFVGFEANKAAAEGEHLAQTLTAKNIAGKKHEKPKTSPGKDITGQKHCWQKHQQKKGIFEAKIVRSWLCADQVPCLTWTTV